MRRLNHADPGIGCRDREQLDMLAGFLGQRYGFGKYFRLLVGEDLIAFQIMLAGRRLRYAVYREHDDIELAGIGLFECLLEMLQMTRIAHGHQNVAGPHMHGFA